MKQKEYVLTEDNYYMPETNLKYLDCSLYKEIAGTPARKGCEARGYKVARGEYIRPKSEALLVGGYVDAYFDHSMPRFLEENLENVYTKASIKKAAEGKGELELLAPFKQADIMIKRAIKEPLFMKYVEGETQKILTADIDGVPIRVKLDSYDGKRITDVKTAASMTKTYYAADLGQRLNFAEAFGYIEQAYFYKEAVRKNFGKDLPFYLAVITKEKEDQEPHPRVAVIQIPDQVIEEKGEEIKMHIHHVWDVIQGNIEPIPCGTCAWCADNLPIERVLSLDEILLEV